MIMDLILLGDNKLCKIYYRLVNGKYHVSKKFICKNNGCTVYYYNEKSQRLKIEDYTNGVLDGTKFVSEDNLIHQKINYKYGKMDGEIITYFAENGNICKIENYKDGIRHGFFENHNINGGVISNGSYNLNKLEGPFIIFYDSQLVKEITNYKNNEKNGYSIEYFDIMTNLKNQPIKIIKNYDNNKLNGDYISYNTDGMVITKSKYKDDVKTGWEYVYDNNKIIKFIYNKNGETYHFDNNTG